MSAGDALEVNFPHAFHRGILRTQGRASRLRFNLAAQFLYLGAAPFAFRHLGFGLARATGFLSASF